MQFHDYSLGDIEEMIPWERTIYLDMIRDHLKQEAEIRREQESAARAAALKKFK